MGERDVDLENFTKTFLKAMRSKCESNTNEIVVIYGEPQGENMTLFELKKGSDKN